MRATRSIGVLGFWFSWGGFKTLCIWAFGNVGKSIVLKQIDSNEYTFMITIRYFNTCWHSRLCATDSSTPGQLIQLFQLCYVCTMKDTAASQAPVYNLPKKARQSPHQPILPKKNKGKRKTLCISPFFQPQQNLQKNATLARTMKNAQHSPCDVLKTRKKNM